MGRRDKDRPPSAISLLINEVCVKPIFVSAKAAHWIVNGREDENASWEARVRYANFLLGVPALLLFLGTVALATAAAVQNAANLEGFYQRSLSQALSKMDDETAVVCLSRLAEFRPSDPQSKFELAVILDAQGKPDQAVGLINDLAPTHRIEFPPAHLWMIKRRLLSKPDPAMLKAIESQLIQLREHAGIGEEAAVLLAEVYLRSDRANFVLREPKLRETAERVPRLHLLVLQELVKQGGEPALQRRLVELAHVFRGELERKPDDVDARVYLSQALALSGDLSGAVVALREGLTIHPQGPFGKLLAELLVTLAARVQQAGILPEEQRRTAYREALDAVQQFADPSPTTDLRRGQLHRLLGEMDPAEEHYLKAVSAIPEARLELAEIYAATNRPVLAGEQLKRVHQDFANQLRSGRPVSTEQRRIAGTACLRLGRYEEAAEWLEPADEAHANRLLYVESQVRWWDSLSILSASQGASVPARLDLLLRALKADPRNAAVLSRLLTLARRSDSLGEQANDVLQTLITESDQKAPAYVVLGSLEFTRGNVDTALKYLEQAYRLDPDADMTLNNLAWVLASANPPDLERALKLANAAVDVTGGALRTRETRYRILMRLSRWEEALIDIEACEPLFRGSVDFHRAAAEVYTNLKLPAPAEKHRLRAEELLRAAQEEFR